MHYIAKKNNYRIYETDMFTQNTNVRDAEKLIQNYTTLKSTRTHALKRTKYIH